MAVFADQLDLRTAVVEAVGTASIVDVWPRILAFAENTIDRRSRHRKQIIAADLTFTAGVAPLPADFLEMINLYGTNGGEMVQAPLSTVNLPYSGNSFYAVDGSSVIVYGFTGDKSAEYYGKIPTISASLTDTNWLLADYPDVYLATCAYEAAKHIRSAEMAGVYETMSARAFDTMKTDSDSARYSQAAVRVGRNVETGGSSPSFQPETGGSVVAPSPERQPPIPGIQQDNARSPSFKMDGTKESFINALLPEAIRVGQETGVDPRIIVAQAAQETGWGKSAPGNNFFGIKSHGQSGGQSLTTHEVIDGKRVKIQDQFRQFDSPAASVQGYGDFITRNPRYRPLREAQGLDAQLEALGASGYATDPNYSQSVGSIARGIPLPGGGTQTAAQAVNAMAGQQPEPILDPMAYNAQHMRQSPDLGGEGPQIDPARMAPGGQPMVQGRGALASALANQAQALPAQQAITQAAPQEENPLARFNSPQLNAADPNVGILQALLARGGEPVVRSQRNADGTYGQPPEGMVMDPSTGQMVDTKSIANQQFGSGMGKAIVAGARGATGIPVLGGLIERNAGMGDPVKQGIADQAFKQFDTENPKTSLGMQIAGGVAGVAPLVAAAPAMMGASPAASLGANSAWSAGSGAVLGGADAATRSGFDPKQMAIGAGAGGVIGGAAPAIGKMIGAGINSVSGMLGLGNKARANSAITEALRRAGMNPSDVADDVARAAADGQGVYTAADALGNPGQRMLSGVARTPGDMRTQIVDKLLTRQSGQGGRLVNAMAEGFNAPNPALNPTDEAIGMFRPSQTAAALKENLSGVRKMSANGLYDAARDGSKAVDLSGALQSIDDIVKPGVNQIASPESGIAGDTIEGALTGLRRRMTDGKSVLTDFDSILNLKGDIDDMIGAATRGGKNKLAARLGTVKKQLDAALEGASDGYRAANDTFAKQSRVIDAIDSGATAQSGRVRSADSIPAFQGMTPDEQAAFRSGYADPLMARIESASSSPTTNKARMLLSEKTAAEFPAFAEPGRGQQLMDRIGREQRMFETSSQALGGSRTADNLADTADIASFDPTILSNLTRGKFGAAAINALQGVGDFARGRNNTTKDMIAKMLIESDPATINKMLGTAITKADGKEVARQAITRALMQSGGIQASGGGGF